MTGASADPLFRPNLLAEQLAVVTGAGSGIGRAVALRLASLGAEVVGIGRRTEPLEETAIQAKGLAGTFRTVSCDIRDVEAAGRAIDEAGAERGINLLVNNAGGQFYAPATAISRRGWDAVIDLNLSALFSLTQAARPHLARTRGAVVNISLTGIDRGIMGAAHSVAARAGVLGLTRTLALEWAPQGIRLNCIGPGLVLTENLDPDARERAEQRREAIPLGRPTTAEEVATLVTFLASHGGLMITGQMLQIDGGAHIGPGLHAWEPEAVSA